MSSGQDRHPGLAQLCITALLRAQQLVLPIFLVPGIFFRALWGVFSSSWAVFIASLCTALYSRKLNNRRHFHRALPTPYRSVRRRKRARKVHHPAHCHIRSHQLLQLAVPVLASVRAKVVRHWVTPPPTVPVAVSGAASPCQDDAANMLCDPRPIRTPSVKASVLAISAS